MLQAGGNTSCLFLYRKYHITVKYESNDFYRAKALRAGCVLRGDVDCHKWHRLGTENQQS